MRIENTASTAGPTWIKIKPATYQWTNAATDTDIELFQSGAGVEAVRVVRHRVMNTIEANMLQQTTFDGWTLRSVNWETSATTDSVTLEMSYGGYWPTWQEATREMRFSPEEQIRRIIAARHAPAAMRSAHRKVLPPTNDEREQRARETLRRVIGEDRFARLLKDGFISVRGQDGLHYQIFPGHGITCVFRKGQMVERLCVVLRGDFPPTDSMIMRYLMILNNPAQFRSFAVKHNVIQRASEQPSKVDDRSLVQIFSDLKKKVA